MADFDTNAEAVQGTEEVVNQQAVEQQEVAEQQAPKVVLTDEVPSAFGQTKKFDYKDEAGNVLRTYNFQFPGIEAGMKIIDLAQKDITEYRKQLLKQLVSDPEVRSKGLEFFDTHKGMFAVLGELDTFLGEMLDGVRG